MQKGHLDSGAAVLASVILLTKNGAAHLGSVLEALHRQRSRGRAEIIMIDSGSSDGTLAIAAAYPELRLVRIPPEEFGHGRTRNLGARLARGEFLVFLPQDATPEGEDWLDRLLAPFADARVAGVYGRQVPRADATAMEQHFLDHAYPAQPALRTLAPGNAPTLAGCFFSTVGGAIRASLWQRHPFDESVIMSEDQAWAKAVLLAGHAIAYQPEARMLHSHAYGVGAIFRRNFDSGYSVRQIFDGRTGISPARAAGALAREALYVLRHGSAGDALRFPAYEAARHLGFWLGTHALRLPMGLRRSCGNLTYFWDQR